MTKLLINPLTKILLSLLAYLSFISALRASSHTFYALLGVLFADNFRFGLFASMLASALSTLLLLVSVYHTKHKELAPPLQWWRRLDMCMLGFLGLWLSMFSLVFIYNSFHTPIGFATTFLFSLLAFYATLFILAELVARIRDNTLKQSCYWLAFFRYYPIYKPLGFLFAALLFANIFILLSILTSPFHFRGLAGVAAFLFLPNWTVAADITNAFFALSAITLIALSHFAAYLLNLSARYEEANLEKIKSERFKSELITNVSHDIRTPLTSIINYVDLLKGEALSGKSAEYTEILDKKSARLKTLIDDLMDASKAGTGNISVNLEKVKLTELLGQVAGEFEDQFAAQDLNLVLREPETIIFANADRRHLWRTWENLFSNAAKYALSGTRVFVELIEDETHAIFTLKNTSAQPIHLSGDTLTEQFIRGDVARKSEGSGLGLYIAKSLTEQMNGQFSIKVSGDLFEVSIVLKKS